MLAERISFRFGQVSLDRYFIDTALIAVFVFLNSIFARVPVITLVLGAVETLFMLYVLFLGSISSLAVTVLVLLSANIENPGFDGLKVPSCNNCHNMGQITGRVHDNLMAERLSKMLGQAIYESKIGSREEFRVRYGKSYL